MALSAKVGSIAIPTSTGTQATTGLGFQPDLLILWTGYPGSSDDAFNAGGYLVFGAAGGAGDESTFSIASDDNLGTTATWRNIATANVFRLMSAGGTSLVAAELDSFDSDGFTLDWTLAPGSANRCNYLAIGGDVDNVNVLSFTTKSSTGTQAYTGVGFQPDLALFFGGMNSGGNVISSYGAADGTNQFAVAVQDRTVLSTTKTARGFSDSKCLVSVWEDAAFVQASLDSFDADGFTLDYSAVSGSRSCIAVCVKHSAECKVGTFNSPTSTGSQATTGVGFEPEAVMLMTTGSADGSVSADAQIGIGAFSGSSEAQAAGLASDDNLGTSDVRRWNGTDAIELPSDTSDAHDLRASATSLDSDGFTLNWSDVLGTAYPVGYIAFGNSASGVDITVQDSSHSHTADSPAITQTHSIAVDDADHSQTADSPSITQSHVITVDEAAHSHAADNVTVSVGAVAISPADADHAHSADSPAITQTHVITVNDATHGHMADTSTVTVGGVTVTLQGANHGHTVDSPLLSQTHIIAVADAVHSHLADSPAVTQTHVIVVQDALHGHAADNVTVTTSIIVIGTANVHFDLRGIEGHRVDLRGIEGLRVDIRGDM